jgi:hypothetical protein
MCPQKNTLPLLTEDTIRDNEDMAQRIAAACSEDEPEWLCRRKNQWNCCALRSSPNDAESHQAGKKMEVSQIYAREYFVVKRFSNRGESRISVRRWEQSGYKREKRIQLLRECEA